ncbi:AAA+-type ATPase, SpoVK/Ycf46/Vps4 family [Alteromonadaceae bacterium Bs31]|nr:AAA+-type ATPase, SpoVK/Ycf46/Vps4 family [Alteromonadaceae bacterium Bs31]
MSVELLNENELQVETQAPLRLDNLILAGLAQLMPANSQNDCPEQAFLRGHLGEHYSPLEMKQGLDRWLEQPALDEQRLHVLFTRYSLELAELLTLCLCVMVEKQTMVGRVLAWLQDPAGGSRPTFGLLEKLLDIFALNNEGISTVILTGAAIELQILHIANTEAPLPEQIVSTPLAVILTLSAKNNIARLPQCRQINASGLALSESSLDECIALAHALSANGTTLLSISTSYREEALAAAALVANTLGKTALLCESPAKLPSGCGIFFSLNKVIPVLPLEFGPEENWRQNEIPGYAGPIIVLCNNHFAIESPRYAIVEWRIPVPDALEREKIWQNYFPEGNAAKTLAAHYIQSAARIHKLAAMAKREAAKHCRSTALQDVINTSRDGKGDSLGSLVQQITEPVSDEGLVLDASLRKQLNSLRMRCANRENLDDKLGISIRQRYHRGVKALMVGPSGTGKTLSASWLAAHLNLPLYRVDSASVVSKYIGETEKNLAKLLNKAESGDVVLLFDEADSLFAKRTEVKDSSDRFANSQTNYLLQRLETYKGIVLLTSNSRARIDQAFLRRLDHIIEFTQPGPEERRKLWRVHLGNSHLLNQKTLNRLAAKCELGGGHIRNAVLTAAVNAQGRNSLIEYADIVEGIECEYRKLGKQMPMGLKA